MSCDGPSTTSSNICGVFLRISTYVTCRDIQRCFAKDSARNVNPDWGPGVKSVKTLLQVSVRLCDTT